MEYVQNAPVSVYIYTCVYEWYICECGYVSACLCGVCMWCMRVRCTNFYTSKQCAYTTENMAYGITV